MSEPVCIHRAVVEQRETAHFRDGLVSIDQQEVVGGSASKVQQLAAVVTEIHPVRSVQPARDVAEVSLDHVDRFVA